MDSKALSADKERRHIHPKALLALFLSLALCSAIVGAAVLHKYRTEILKMDQVIIEKGAKIAEVVSRLLYKTQALEALVFQAKGEVEDFTRVAKPLLDDPAILNVLLAPGGVVTNVYPLEGNESLLGYSLLGEGAGNKEAIQAKQMGQLVFGGPFTLVQGGQALVGRLPVWLQTTQDTKRFWGLVSVTLKYPDALDGAQLQSLQEQDLAFEIWRINPDDGQKQVIAHSPYTYKENSHYIEQSLNILNAEWFFRILPIRGWYEYAENWVLIAIGIGMSLLIAYTVQKNCDLTEAKKDLESMVMTDALTGLPNRQDLFTRITDLIAKKTRFQLAYIDLNYFKQINDVYGHNFGDDMLIEFAKRMRRELTEGIAMYRMSGDEFVVVFTGASQAREAVDAFWAKTDKLFAEPTGKIDGNDIYLSFSRGAAAYPEDGGRVDDLISCADKRMYKEKHYRYSIEKRRRASDYKPLAFQKIFN